MGLAAAAGVGYLAYESFLGGKKSGKARRVKPVVVVKPNVNPGEPDMEWIRKLRTTFVLSVYIPTDPFS